jgi:hypothetical protein
MLYTEGGGGIVTEEKELINAQALAKTLESFCRTQSGGTQEKKKYPV